MRKSVTVILLIAIGLALFVLPEPWRPWVIGAGAAIELVETAVEVWWSRRGHAKVGPETLIGATGIITAECRPTGQARVRGEVWLARCDNGADVGQRVRVVGRDGLTLLVTPEV